MGVTELAWILGIPSPLSSRLANQLTGLEEKHLSKTLPAHFIVTEKNEAFPLYLSLHTCGNKACFSQHHPSRS